MNETQAATDTDDAATQASEGTGEQEPSLEEFLSEHEEASDDTEQRTDTPPPKDLEGKLERLMSAVEQQERTIRQEREARASEQADADLTTAVTELAADPDVKTNQKVVDKYLRGLLLDDKRALSVWINRKSNPDAFKKLLAGAKAELKQARQEDADQDLSDRLTGDRQAARASVRSHSSEPEPEQPNVTEMSDADFAKLRQNLPV